MFIFDFSKIIYRYLLSDACFFVIPSHFTVMADLIGHPSSLVLTRHARLRPGISLIPSKASIPSVGDYTLGPYIKVMLHIRVSTSKPCRYRQK